MLPALYSGTGYLPATIPASTLQPPAPGYRLTWLPARKASAGRDAGMYWKRRRQMNPLNPRALVRAEKRMSVFTHWVKRHFTVANSFPRRKKARRFGGRRGK